MTTNYGVEIIGSIEGNHHSRRRHRGVPRRRGAKFAEQTVGAMAGERRTVDIAMTDAVAVEKLRGQTVKAVLEVKDVKKMRLPELTPNSWRTSACKTSSSCTSRCASCWNAAWNTINGSRPASRSLTQITSASQWELPQDCSCGRHAKRWHAASWKCRKPACREEEIQARQRILQQDVLQSTAMSLKEHFVLQKIAEVEKIEVDDDEIARRSIAWPSRLTSRRARCGPS